MAGGFVWVACLAVLCVFASRARLTEELSSMVFMGRTENAVTLSGRIPLWTELVPYISKSPLLGYGFETFWTTEHIRDISGRLYWAAQEAHSAYLESVLHTGLVGAGLVLLLVFAGMAVSGKRYMTTKVAGYGFVFGLLVFGLIDGAFESGMVRAGYGSFVLGCGLMHLALRRDRTFGTSQRLLGA
jgi:O-antigen ligase